MVRGENSESHNENGEAHNNSNSKSKGRITSYCVLYRFYSPSRSCLKQYLGALEVDDISYVHLFGGCIFPPQRGVLGICSSQSLVFLCMWFLCWFWTKVQTRAILTILLLPCVILKAFLTSNNWNKRKWKLPVSFFFALLERCHGRWEFVTYAACASVIPLLVGWISLTF